MRNTLTTLALALAVTTGAHAQAWPAKPVTLLVPFPPGGSTDMIARRLGTKLQDKLGGIFIVDTRRAPVVPSAPLRPSARRPTATLSSFRRLARS